MIHNAEQTRKFMESVKNGNLKFPVDKDVERRLLKEEVAVEGKQSFKIGNSTVTIDTDLKNGYFHIYVQSGANKPIVFKYGMQNIEEDTFIKIMDILSKNR